MSLKTYLLLMSAGTLICWISWFFVIFKISPISGGFAAIFAFYLSLLLSIVGTFSVLGFLTRSWLYKNDEAVFRQVKNTFRQSIFIGITVISIFILASKSLLFWWNGSILIAFFFFVEATFFTSKKEKNLPDENHA